MGRKTEEEEEKTNANSAKSPITVTGTGTSGRERLQCGAKEAVRRPTALPSILAAGQLPCGSPTQGTIETIFPGKENRAFLEQWHYTRRCAHTLSFPSIQHSGGHEAQAREETRHQPEGCAQCGQPPGWTRVRKLQGRLPQEAKSIKAKRNWHNHSSAALSSRST